jgi:hypothetical protein
MHGAIGYGYFVMQACKKRMLQLRQRRLSLRPERRGDASLFARVVFSKLWHMLH